MNSVQVLLLVGFDRHIALRISNTSQDEAIGNLVVAKEGLVGLVDLATLHKYKIAGLYYILTRLIAIDLAS